MAPESNVVRISKKNSSILKQTQFWISEPSNIYISYSKNIAVNTGIFSPIVHEFLQLVLLAVLLNVFFFRLASQDLAENEAHSFKQATIIYRQIHFIIKGEQRNSTTLMMWNTCEQLHTVKQHKGDLLFCLFKKFVVSILFSSSFWMQNGCHLFSLVDSADERKATNAIAYTQIGLYHLSTIR